MVELAEELLSLERFPLYSTFNEPILYAHTKKSVFLINGEAGNIVLHLDFSGINSSIHIVCFLPIASCFLVSMSDSTLMTIPVTYQMFMDAHLNMESSKYFQYNENTDSGNGNKIDVSHIDRVQWLSQVDILTPITSPSAYFRINTLPPTITSNTMFGSSSVLNDSTEVEQDKNMSMANSSDINRSKVQEQRVLVTCVDGTLAVLTIAANRIPAPPSLRKRPNYKTIPDSASKQANAWPNANETVLSPRAAQQIIDMNSEGMDDDTAITGSSARKRRSSRTESMSSIGSLVEIPEENASSPAVRRSARTRSNSQMSQDSSPSTTGRTGRTRTSIASQEEENDDDDDDSSEENAMDTSFVSRRAKTPAKSRATSIGSSATKNTGKKSTGYDNYDNGEAEGTLQPHVIKVAALDNGNVSIVYSYDSPQESSYSSLRLACWHISPQYSQSAVYAEWIDYTKFYNHDSDHGDGLSRLEKIALEEQEENSNTSSTSLITNKASAMPHARVISNSKVPMEQCVASTCSQDIDLSTATYELCELVAGSDCVSMLIHVILNDNPSTKKNKKGSKKEKSPTHVKMLYWIRFAHNGHLLKVRNISGNFSSTTHSDIRTSLASYHPIPINPYCNDVHTIISRKPESVSYNNDISEILDTNGNAPGVEGTGSKDFSTMVGTKKGRLRYREDEIVNLQAGGLFELGPSHHQCMWIFGQSSSNDSSEDQATLWNVQYGTPVANVSTMLPTIEASASKRSKRDNNTSLESSGYTVLSHPNYMEGTVVKASLLTNTGDTTSSKDDGRRKLVEISVTYPEMSPSASSYTTEYIYKYTYNSDTMATIVSRNVVPSSVSQQKQNLSSVMGKISGGMYDPQSGLVRWTADSVNSNIENDYGIVSQYLKSQLRLSTLIGNIQGRKVVSAISREGSYQCDDALLSHIKADLSTPKGLNTGYIHNELLKIVSSSVEHVTIDLSKGILQAMTAALRRKLMSSSNRRNEVMYLDEKQGEGDLEEYMNQVQRQEEAQKLLLDDLLEEEEEEEAMDTPNTTPAKSPKGKKRKAGKNYDDNTPVANHDSKEKDEFSRTPRERVPGFRVKKERFELNPVAVETFLRLFEARAVLLQSKENNMSDSLGYEECVLVPLTQAMLPSKDHEKKIEKEEVQEVSPAEHYDEHSFTLGGYINTTAYSQHKRQISYRFIDDSSKGKSKGKGSASNMCFPVTSSDWDVLLSILRSGSCSINNHRNLGGVPSLIASAAAYNRLDVLGFIMRFCKDLTEDQAMEILLLAMSMGDQISIRQNFKINEIGVLQYCLRGDALEQELEATQGQKKEKGTKANGKKKRGARPAASSTATSSSDRDEPIPSALDILRVLCEAFLKRRASYTELLLSDAMRRKLSTEQAYILLRVFSNVIKAVCPFVDMERSLSGNKQIHSLNAFNYGTNITFSLSSLADKHIQRAIDFVGALLDAHFSDLTMKMTLDMAAAQSLVPQKKKAKGSMKADKEENMSTITQLQALLISYRSLHPATEAVESLLGLSTHLRRTLRVKREKLKERRLKGHGYGQNKVENEIFAMPPPNGLYRKEKIQF